MISFLIITFFFLVVSFCTGYLLSMFKNIDWSWALKISFGFLINIGLFHIISVPFMYFELSFSPLYWITILYCFLVIFVSIMILWKNRKCIDLNVKRIFKDYQKKDIIIGLLCTVTIFLQIYVVICYQHTDIDDSFYLAQVNTVLHTNSLQKIDAASGIGMFGLSADYQLVSYEVLLAVFIKLFNINTAYFAHSVLPAFLILLHYIIVFELGKKISKKYSLIFVLIYSLLNIFSGYSGYSQGAFLLFRIWQGKSVMINIVIPLLVLIFCLIYHIKKVSTVYIFLLFMILNAGFHTTAVGLYLVPIMYFSLVISYVLITKSERIKSFFKLCIPVLFSLPYVLLKAYILFFTTTVGSKEIVTVFENYQYLVTFKNVFLASNYGLLLLYVISFLYILIFADRLHKGVFCFSSIILMLTFLNPFIDNFVANNITGVAVYWRLFWLLNIPMTIACSFTLFVERIKIKYIKPVIICFEIILLYFNGTIIFRNQWDYFTLPENKYKLDENTVQIVNAINAHSDNEEVLLLVPMDWSYGVREYCGNIQLINNRYVDSTFVAAGLEDDLQKLYDELINPLYTEKIWNASQLDTSLKYFHIDYVALYTESINQNVLPDSFTEIKDAEDFVLYHID